MIVDVFNSGLVETGIEEEVGTNGRGKTIGNVPTSDGRLQLDEGNEILLCFALGEVVSLNMTFLELWIE